MENKKKLAVRCAVCDVRNVTEEILSAYEKVEISCSCLISSQSARTLLSRYQAEISTASTLDLDGDIRMSTVNGRMCLTPSQVIPEEKTFLMLNGTLDIAPGCEEVLKSYAAGMVNGTVNVPEDMAGLLSGFTVNGSIVTYPGGCIRLKPTTVLDRTFLLRAKQDALYYAAKKMIALNGDIDFGKLAEKNVRFTTKKLMIAESLVEAALPLFDEKTDIEILADGCAYVDGDAALDEALVRRYGGKLYVDGDLILLEDGPWLDQVTCLRANDVLVTRELEDRLNAIDAVYDSLYLVGGVLMMSKSEARLTRSMLEGAERGVSFVSCANVTVDEEIPAQLLQEKLVSVIACGGVVCTEEQQAAIERVAQLTDSIGPEDDKEDAKSPEKDPNVVEISAAFYTL